MLYFRSTAFVVTFFRHGFLGAASGFALRPQPKSSSGGKSLVTYAKLNGYGRVKQETCIRNNVLKDCITDFYWPRKHKDIKQVLSVVDGALTYTSTLDIPCSIFDIQIILTLIPCRPVHIGPLSTLHILPIMGTIRCYSFVSMDLQALASRIRLNLAVWSAKLGILELRIWQRYLGIGDMAEKLPLIMDSRGENKLPNSLQRILPLISLAHESHVSFAAINRWGNDKTTPARLARTQSHAFCQRRADEGRQRDVQV